MFLVLSSLVAGVALLLLGVGKIGHVGDMVSTVSIGVSLGLLLFAISYGAFGRRRRSATGKSVPGEGAGG